MIVKNLIWPPTSPAFVAAAERGANILASRFKIGVIERCYAELCERAILPFRVPQILSQCLYLLPVLPHRSGIGLGVDIAFDYEAEHAELLIVLEKRIVLQRFCKLRGDHRKCLLVALNV